MNWYDLTRQRFDMRFEHIHINSKHTEMYFYIVDLWNRVWQKKEFGLPTIMTMENLNIWSRNTYYQIYNDLLDLWFVKEIRKSVNQNQSRIISLVINKKWKWKSKLDKAICFAWLNIEQASEQTTEQASEQTTEHIDKQINKETNKDNFDNFWSLYPHARSSKKQDAKKFYNESKYREDEITAEIKYMNWCIRYWIIDWSFVKWCALRIRDFVPTNPHIKDQNIKKIVYALMKEKNPEVAKQITNDFGKEIVDKYVKEYNKEFNTPILK